jgi:hypothetical protein
MRANTMGLGKRVLSRAALLAPATLLCLASASSMAAVIDSGPLNINVVPNIDGLYVNFVTGANANGTLPGWDFNPYANATNLTFFTSTGAANTNAVVGAAGIITALAPGATIGPASAFISPGNAGTAGTAFRATGTVYAGVRFTRESDSTVHYGYAEMTTTTGTGFPAVLVRYAYDDTPNTPITIPLPTAAPIFAYTPAAASTVTFTGGTLVGTTGNASIAVSVATPGVGTGPAATTTTTCTAPTAPFAGFGQTVTAEGVGAITGSPLAGTCVLGDAVATQTLTCSENRGGTPTAVTFTLSCPAGTQPPLTSTPASGSTITLPGYTLGGAATTAPLQFQNPGTLPATVTCTAPTATEFTVAPLSIPVPAGGNFSTTISFSTAAAGTFTGTLNCTAGAQSFTYSLSGNGSAQLVAVPTLDNWGRLLLALLVLGIAAPLLLVRRS